MLVLASLKSYNSYMKNTVLTRSDVCFQQILNLSLAQLQSLVHYLFPP